MPIPSQEWRGSGHLLSDILKGILLILLFIFPHLLYKQTYHDKKAQDHHDST